MATGRRTKLAGAAGLHDGPERLQLLERSHILSLACGVTGHLVSHLAACPFSNLAIKVALAPGLANLAI
jgi:hypothetical protein